MRFGTNSNAQRTSMLICPEGASEPCFENTAGIYLGMTAIYGTPFFLDSRRLLNPHVAALGMSGSGKSYFLKSIAARSALCCNTNVFVLDWTGEYHDVISFLGGSALDPHLALSSSERLLHSAVSSVELSRLKCDSERRRAASELLDLALEQMRRSCIDKGLRQMIVLDEAWRFIESSAEVRAMFREGRKYGFGIVTATQLASDVSREMLSNSACVAIFRLQSGADCRLLLETGLLDERDKQLAQRLPQGACMLSLAARETEANTKFLIPRIDGVDTRLYHLIGDFMQIRIQGREFQRITEQHFRSVDTRLQIEGYATSNDRELDAIAFIRFLLSIDLARAEVMPYLRALGMRDVEMVEAYERAQQ